MFNVTPHLIGLQKIILFMLSGLFCSCSSDADKWNEIKKTKNIYPKDSISSYNFKLADSFERRWTNDAYKNYEFKKYCPRKVEFKFETSIPRVRELLYIDTFGIAKMLQDDLKKKGVSHFIGQALAPHELNIYFYFEEEFFPHYPEYRIKIPCIMLFQSDPAWKFYNKLIEKK